MPPQILGFGGHPPPSWWVSSPTSLVVFPSSCSRSMLISPHLSLHPFLEFFSLTNDLLSPPRAAAKPSFPPMRPPPEPPPQNNERVVMVVSPISNPKTVFQALSLMAAPPPSWLTPTRPPPKPPWLGCDLDLLLADVSLVHSFNGLFCVLLLILFCFKYVFMVFEEMSQGSLTYWNRILIAKLLAAPTDLNILTTKQIDSRHVNTLDKFETINSRTVLAEVKEMIRNWIDLKTLDSLFNFAIDHMWKNLAWLFGSKDGKGFASLYLYLCSVYQILVDLVFMFSFSVWMGYVPTHLFVNAASYVAPCINDGCVPASV
jgi:hypothetical protein